MLYFSKDAVLALSTYYQTKVHSRQLPTFVHFETDLVIMYDTESIYVPVSYHINRDSCTPEYCEGSYLETSSDKTVDHSIDIRYTNRPSALVLMSSPIVGRDLISLTSKNSWKRLEWMCSIHTYIWTLCIARISNSYYRMRKGFIHDWISWLNKYLIALIIKNS